MDWLSVALQLFDHAVELYSEELKTKYKDRKIKLMTEYYNEKNKPEPNNALLDDLEHDLFVLCSTVGSPTQGPSAPAKA